MSFWKNWLFGRSTKINDFFANAVRVYVLKGEEDARCAAVAAAKIASKKQRKSMIASLSKMELNVMRNGHHNLALKPLADRLLSLKEDLGVIDWEGRDFEEEKGKLSKLNEEYLSCLNRLDPSVFPRKFPNLF